MKKKIVFRIIALFLIIGVSVYYYNEYKTKSLLSDCTYESKQEKHYISILYESELERKLPKLIFSELIKTIFYLQIYLILLKI